MKQFYRNQRISEVFKGNKWDDQFLLFFYLRINFGSYVKNQVVKEKL